jgi:peptide deformylase
MSHKVLTVEQSLSVLAQRSRNVSTDELKSVAFQSFIDELIQVATTAVTREGWRAAGLAAIQLGMPLNVFLVREAKNDSFQVFINPTIEFLGEAKDIRAESCLSVPGVVGDVERFKRIRVTFLNRTGTEQRVAYDGYLSRAIQHEYDHLLGILFTTKVV